MVVSRKTLFGFETKGLQSKEGLKAVLQGVTYDDSASDMSNT